MYCMYVRYLYNSMRSLLRKNKKCLAGAPMVGSSLLIDPVIFLLCDPTVATMFVYKDPTNALDLLMHFFLSRSKDFP